MKKQTSRKKDLESLTVSEDSDNSHLAWSQCLRHHHGEQQWQSKGGSPHGAGKQRKGLGSPLTCSQLSPSSSSPWLPSSADYRARSLDCTPAAMIFEDVSSCQTCVSPGSQLLLPVPRNLSFLLGFSWSLVERKDSSFQGMSLANVMSYRFSPFLLVHDVL